MNTLDYIMIGLVLLGGWNGYRAGMVKQLTRLFGVVIAYALARYLRPYLTPVLEQMHIITQPQGAIGLLFGNVDGAIAFGIIFIVAWLLLRYGAGLLDTLFHLPGLSLLNRLAGFIIGLVIVIVFLYIASLLAQYIPSPALQTALKHSYFVQQWMQIKWSQASTT